MTENNNNDDNNNKNPKKVTAPTGPTPEQIRQMIAAEKAKNNAKPKIRTAPSGPQDSAQDQEKQKQHNLEQQGKEAASHTAAALGKITPKQIPADMIPPPKAQDATEKAEAEAEVPPQKPLKKKKNKIWGSEERQFLPAALEIMETPANPATRILALSLAGFFSLSLIWAFLGEIDVVAVATGQIVPAGGVKKIQALEIGTVRTINVIEGQLVKKGDLLIQLDPTDSEVDAEQMKRQQSSAELDIARLEATLYGVLGEKEIEFRPPSNVDANLLKLAEQQIASDLASFTSQLSSLNVEHERVLKEKEGIRIEIEKLKASLPLITDRERALNDLVQKGIAPKLNWLQVKQQQIEIEHNIKIQEKRLQESDASLKGLKVEVEKITASEQQRIFDQLTEARDQLDSATLALRKAEKREILHGLYAPVDGVVQQLNAQTVGGVVTPADPVMLIVPANAKLEIQAKILNKDAGFISTGQQAEIKIDSFPFTKYGTIDGTIRHISQDAIIDENLGPIFDARVQMDKNNISADGREVILTPGMTASVEVKTGKRKVIEFLLSPLMRYQQEALRER